MSKYILKKGFISQKIGDKITIFDGEQSVMYTFNQSAAFIFEKLKQGIDKDKIIDLLAKKYDIKREKAKIDVEKFIADLKSKKVL